MSPLPNRPLQPPNSYAADNHAAESADTSQVQQQDTSDLTPPQPQRPLMRPVARPTPPPPPPSEPTPAPVASAPEPSNDEPSEAESLESAIAGMRQQPIPAPSEPMQYRAIGLVRGRYKASEEQFTRGEMTTTDGTTIEAVLLGRVMSLVKNHLDLEQDHLWVVYPRTREKQEDLHVQIVGVWEPEKLSKPEEAEEGEQANYVPSSEVDDNYFSIRGEIIFHAPESQTLGIKIQQAPRKKNDRARMFKLKLKGELTGKTIGYFWELNVHREGPDLVIRDGRSIGMIPPKKRPKGMGRGGPSGGKFGRKPPFRPKPGGGGRPQGGPPPQQPKRKEPLPKPVKRSKEEGTPTEENNNVTSEA
jgi:hypothetical protein